MSTVGAMLEFAKKTATKVKSVPVENREAYVEGLCDCADALFVGAHPENEKAFRAFLSDLLEWVCTGSCRFGCVSPWAAYEGLLAEFQK